jgi:hypothetical protein
LLRFHEEDDEVAGCCVEEVDVGVDVDGVFHEDAFEIESGPQYPSFPLVFIPAAR